MQSQNVNILTRSLKFKQLGVKLQNLQNSNKIFNILCQVAATGTLRQQDHSRYSYSGSRINRFNQFSRGGDAQVACVCHVMCNQLMY